MKNLCSFCLKLEEIEILSCNHTICTSCVFLLPTENKTNTKMNCPFACEGNKIDECFSLKKLVSSYFNMIDIIKCVFSNEKNLIATQTLAKINIMRESNYSTNNDSEPKSIQISENLAKKIAEKNLLFKKYESQKPTMMLNELQKNFSSESNSKNFTSNLLERVSINSEHHKNISVQELSNLKQKICRNQLRKTIKNNNINKNAKDFDNKDNLVKNENQLFSTMNEIRKHFTKAPVELGSPRVLLKNGNNENYMYENKKRLSNLINLNNIQKTGRREAESNDKTETLNQSSFTNFSALQERNIIQKIILEKYQGNIDFINKFDEESMFIVNADWWRKWTDYVNFEYNIENMKGL